MSAADSRPMATAWFKSPRSAPDSNCVQIRHLAYGHTEVRHSRDPSGTVLVFTAGAWTGLLETIAAQPFPADSEWMLAQPDHRCCAQARYTDAGTVEFTQRDAEPGESLTFTTAEWDAFIGGVGDGTMVWRAPDPYEAGRLADDRGVS